MKLSKERLLAEAAATEFRPDTLEKAVRLLSLLTGLRSHPFLKERLALKGGTALNLFVFDVPRLSVDIDVNYIGSSDRAVMDEERPLVEQAIAAVCGREGFAVRRVPSEHAGGKWYLRYSSALGQNANLELDLNFMFRMPLWPPVTRDSRAIGSYRSNEIRLMDVHEIAAGKLAALLSRRTSRDLFDARQLYSSASLRREALRICFVVYGAVNRKDWRKVSTDDVNFKLDELKNFLLPLLRTSTVQALGTVEGWATRLVSECKEGLSIVLPFEEHENEFLSRLLDHGEIKSSLLTGDEEMITKIENHPGLLWKALNVREFKRR
ncbi:MAG: nucleotidyl transferase AbiEii/AbiGii toxin family protein [Deltaproteobacteria bacterium]|nr:nucleotidyl transferase AbiEii/AbiGii toxin family protein [Deltaproteobacteria bacterium]MBI2181366.1 nucleotidyl transferase AbiEii/AbiGii toxin family protein [Deltaproteobacteria bacterium]MBI2231813.1 nucleotidyl transferase AbiEii/AbiGii toxin family protein [Deltaproteobacteria bacterium]MBI2365428.1 nucleotidyl transferase AbiEii/AbiGii toxin family protein [Deltaproteobacteria bacterium]MBI3064255.1 nucleotidyl transferase AbiEii/AbiGii toxin family protein [Deltaproteobacteria bact